MRLHLKAGSATVSIQQVDVVSLEVLPYAFRHQITTSSGARRKASTYVEVYGVALKTITVDVI